MPPEPTTQNMANDPMLMAKPPDQPLAKPTQETKKIDDKLKPDVSLTNKSPKSDVTSAVIATVIIVIVLACLAVYAYLKQN